MPVQRVIYYAKPTNRHADLREWETAIIVMLLNAVGRKEGLEQARAYLLEKNWQPIRLLEPTPINEGRAAALGGEFWEAYLHAKGKELFCQIFMDTFLPGHKRYGILSPQLNEQFMDRVVQEAGGRRLAGYDLGCDRRNADYLSDDWVFELKQPQEEGLEKKRGSTS